MSDSGAIIKDEDLEDFVYKNIPNLSTQKDISPFKEYTKVKQNENLEDALDEDDEFLNKLLEMQDFIASIT